MAPLATLLLLSQVFFSIIYAAAVPSSFTIPSFRDVADDETIALRKRQSGSNPSVLGRSLYWFGNFSVGDSGYLKLLIDTGSTDLIVNNGLYALSWLLSPAVDQRDMRKCKAQS